MKPNGDVYIFSIIYPHDTYEMMTRSSGDPAAKFGSTEVSVVEIFKDVTVNHDKHIKYEFQRDC